MENKKLNNVWDIIKNIVKELHPRKYTFFGYIKLLIILIILPYIIITIKASIFQFFNRNNADTENKIKEIQEKVEKGKSEIKKEMDQKFEYLNQQSEPMIKRGVELESKAHGLFGYLEEKEKVDAEARRDYIDQDIAITLEAMKKLPLDKISQIDSNKLDRVYNRLKCYDIVEEEKRMAKAGILNSIKKANQAVEEINRLQKSNNLSGFDKERLEQNITLYNKVKAMDKDTSDEGLERSVAQYPSSRLKECLIRADKVLPVVMKYDLRFIEEPGHYYSARKKYTIVEKWAKLQEMFGIAKDIDFTIYKIRSEKTKVSFKARAEARITNSKVSEDVKAKLRYLDYETYLKLKKISPDNPGFTYNAYKSYVNSRDYYGYPDLGTDYEKKYDEKVIEFSKDQIKDIKIIDANTIGLTQPAKVHCDYPYKNLKISDKITVEKCYYPTGKGDYEYIIGRIVEKCELTARGTLHRCKDITCDVFYDKKAGKYNGYAKVNQMYEDKKKKQCKKFGPKVLKYQLFGIEVPMQKQSVLNNKGEIEKIDFNQKGKEFLQEKFSTADKIKCRIWNKKGSSNRYANCKPFYYVKGTGSNQRTDIDFLSTEYVNSGFAKATDKLNSHNQKVQKEKAKTLVEKCLKDGICKNIEASIWQQEAIEEYRKSNNTLEASNETQQQDDENEVN